MALGTPQMEALQPESSPSAPVAVADAPAGLPAAPPISTRRLAVAHAAPRSGPTQLARLTAPDLAALAPSRMAGVIGQPKPAGGSTQTSLAALSAPPFATAPSPVVRDAQPSLPLPGPISRKPAAGFQAPPAMPTADPGRLTLGQSRRLGLGPPIGSAPATALSAIAAERAAPLPLSAPTPAQTKPQDEPTAAAPTTPATPANVSRPVAARRLPGAGPTPAVSGSARPSAPLVSVQPLRTRVQRAPLAGARTARSRDERDEAPAVPGGPVRVHRGSVAAELSESLDAKAFTHQGEIYLPQSAGPMGSPTARSLIAHELTHVAQQRAYGSRLPQEHTAHGQELEAKAAAAERHPELPLAQPASRPASSESASAEVAATAQRKPAAASREPASTVETTTINFAGHAQRASADKAPKSARSTIAASDGKKSETELEELAGQLYTRISRRLRRELLVDRERAGLMVDLP